MSLFPGCEPVWPEWFCRGKQPGKNVPHGQVNNVNAGRHPMGMPLMKDAGERKCGNCEHHEINESSKTYHKCDLNNTCCTATDIRLHWPACSLWEKEL